MKSILLVFLLLLGTSVSAGSSEKPGRPPDQGGLLLARVRHITRVKIVESTAVTTRPGSIYDNITYFESFAGWPKPLYFYEFVDSGLGAAEPLYPMLQAGEQGSWLQLIPAFFSKKARHIDHFSSLPTPEGCQVDSAYLLRHMSEFPKEMYVQERAEGYEMIVIRLEYYTKLYPGAVCGRRVANDPDPNFDPIQFMRDSVNARSFADFPADKLKRFDARVAAIYHVDENFINGDELPRFDPSMLKNNSNWYYPNGVPEDYGLTSAIPQAGDVTYSRPSDMITHSSDELARRFTLDRFISTERYDQMLSFLSGQPVRGFDPRSEPGSDTLDIRDVGPQFFYTSGTEYEPIRTAVEDVSDRSNLKFAGLVVRPHEPVAGLDQPIPQFRFVYQLIDPRHDGRPLEQLYYHVVYDGVDRYTDAQTRQQQHEYFLRRYDQVVQAREASPEHADEILDTFVSEFTQEPLRLQKFAFSSSLTGIWVFGMIARQGPAHDLQPLWVLREGIPIGYYSTAYDNDLFRKELKKARKAKNKARVKILKKHLDDITPRFYRDPRRNDVHAINFDRVTCAQCHQFSARDAVHFALNDGVDPRYKKPSRPTEFIYKEIEAQLKTGQKWWLAR